MRDACAWALPMLLCFALFFVSLRIKIYAQNYAFFGWLLLGLLVELAFCSSIAGRWPRFTAAIAELDDVFGILLAAGAVFEAAYRLGWFVSSSATQAGTPALQRVADPVNHTIFGWMALLVALDLVCLVTTRTNLGYRILAWFHPAEFAPAYVCRVENWLANIAFFVPALGMLIALSGTHIDRLWAWVSQGVSGQAPGVSEVLSYARSILG